MYSFFFTVYALFVFIAQWLVPRGGSPAGLRFWALMFKGRQKNYDLQRFHVFCAFLAYIFLDYDNSGFGMERDERATALSVV